jgi:hypothetical protein
LLEPNTDALGNITAATCRRRATESYPKYGRTAIISTANAIILIRIFTTTIRLLFLACLGRSRA